METSSLDYLQEYVTQSEWHCLLGRIVHLDPTELIVDSIHMLTFCTKHCRQKENLALALFRCTSYDIFSSIQAKPYIFHENVYRDPQFIDQLFNGIELLLKKKQPVCFFEYYLAIHAINPHVDPNGMMCYLATIHGNLEFFAWLQDPTTGGGVYVWDKSSCIIATKYKHFAMLRWLRSPTTGLGVYYWNRAHCLHYARKFKNRRMLQWIKKQPE